MKFIKNKIQHYLLTTLMLVFGIQMYAQKQQWGSRFDYDVKNELAPKLVMIDNYNYYLLTVVNTTGMMANNQILLRKFDQKNNLVETIKHRFPELEGGGTLHNFLGSFDLGTDRAVVFTQSYSSKSKRDVISQHVFDKATQQFTTSIVTEYPIASVYKSGEVTVKRSPNGNRIVLHYKVPASKKESEVNYIFALNGQTLDVDWKKEVRFDIGFYTGSMTVTNSGNVVLLRLPHSYKLDNYLVEITAEGQKDLTVGENLKLHDPFAVSIGDHDYLLAFNYPSKGIRRGDFGHLLFYDLKNGSILANNEIKGFNSEIKIETALIKDVLLQNDEIYVFTEAKVDVTPKPTPGTMGFPEKKFTFGPCFLFTLGFDGKLKKTNPFPKGTVGEAELFHSFGLVRGNSDLYVQTGLYNGFFKWNYLFNNEELARTISFHFYDDNREGVRVRYVNQLLHYFRDKDAFLFSKITTTDKDQMSFGTFSEVK